MYYKIKKPEELKKKKKLDYIHLYECFQDMEKKYTEMLYKYDEVKKDNEKKEQVIDNLSNKIIDLELCQDEISIDVNNMRGKSIKILGDTIKDLRILQKELENKKYGKILEKEEKNSSYNESLLDYFSTPMKTLTTEEIIEDIIDDI